LTANLLERDAAVRVGGGHLAHRVPDDAVGLDADELEEVSDGDLWRIYFYFEKKQNSQTCTAVMPTMQFMVFSHKAASLLFSMSAIRSTPNSFTAAAHFSIVSRKMSILKMFID